MLKQACLYFALFLVLTSRQCLVLSGGAPGDAIAGRYSTHAPSDVHQHHLQHQQSLQHSTQQHTNQAHSSSGSSNAAATVPASQAALYHAGAGSGGHLENRNSYNLLSEAMSQAVSNEFSTLGSGSADGACHADDLDCYSGNVQDRLGMEAIRTLHRQLDDDDNGNIDLSESDDFLREELKYDSGYEKRQKAFHFNDDMHISVKELWEAWLRSEVHNWTIEQTTDWLAQSVQLPQYVELFKIHKVTGAALPRLAVNNMHYVGNVLGIKDPIHKQKIALKAMDVVLFGPPRETGTRWKDYILVTLLLSAIIGVWYAYQQNKNAKRHLRRMAQDMEGLQRAEQSLQEMQKELERARMEQENVATEKMDLERRLKEAPSLSSSNSDLEVQQLKKEIEMLRSELSRAEIELVDNCWTPPPQLQSWLQYTYELESKNHLKKRMSAEKQLQSAREACEKLRKKRSSLVGAFVSTHGKSIDDVDRSIVEARNSLSEVTNELQERLHRWKQIETCLGLNIVNNNGLSYLESVLYGRNGGPSKGSRGRMTSSTDDLDDESVQVPLGSRSHSKESLSKALPIKGMLDTYSRSSVPAGLGGGGSSGIVNSNSHMLRDDSSGSEDGADTQSVQFYLGGAPPVMNTMVVPMTPTHSITTRTHLPLDNAASNHIGNSLSAMTTTPAPITSSFPVTAPSPASALPPPLPPHSNAHSSFSPNDSVIGDDSSPSVSSERSIPVPPRTKKQIMPPVVPPPPSGPIGRAPLPPPRKSNQSQLLRSQSTDLVPMEIYSYISRQQQQPSIASGQPLFSGAVANSSGSSKKMVKQHSSASQQSTSSTSSSVQSAPTGADVGKAHSPARWSSHERIMPVHQEHQLLVQHQHQLHHQQLHKQHQHGDKEPLLQPMRSTPIPAAATPRATYQMSASNSLQSLCGKPQYGSGASTATAASSTTVASSHSDTKVENQLLLSADSASSDGSLRKRKRRLRFPFGSSKKSSNSAGSNSASTKGKFA